MRARAFIILFAIVLTVSFAPRTYSMAPRPTSGKKGSVKPIPVTASGKVIGYNWTASTITILTEANITVTLNIEKNTVVSKARKAIKMTDIKRGDLVTVIYEIKADKNIAKSIIIQDKKKQ